MRILFAAAVSLVALFAALNSTQALTTPNDAPPAARSHVELIVMEADGCIYCGLFRRDVLPVFEASARGKTMPVRFLDINDIEKTPLKLQRPIDMLPTFVVVVDGAEIGRIPGYVGREDFFHSINYVLSSNGHDDLPR